MPAENTPICRSLPTTPVTREVSQTHGATRRSRFSFFFALSLSLSLSSSSALSHHGAKHRGAQLNHRPIKSEIYKVQCKKTGNRGSVILPAPHPYGGQTQRQRIHFQLLMSASEIGKGSTYDVVKRVYLTWGGPAFLTGAATCSQKKLMVSEKGEGERF